MPNAAVITLERARLERDTARRARMLDLAVETRDPDLVFRLIQYVREMQESAQDFESCAEQLEQTLANTMAISADLKALVHEARQLLQNMKARQRAAPTATIPRKLGH